MHVEDKEFVPMLKEAKSRLARWRVCRNKGSLVAKKRYQAILDHCTPEFRAELFKRGGDPQLAYLVAFLNGISP